MAESKPAAAALPGVHSHRVIFIDLARALAVVLMLYGHTVSTVLADEYRAGTWFEIWVFQRGLTSSLFLLLSGFAFSIATGRHWAAHVRLSANLVRRVRRFGLFVLLGYALHFPARRLAELSTAGEEQWRTFLAVDVLQLIGVTFIAVQLLVLATRTRRVFTIAAFVIGAIVVAVTPWLWRTESISLPAPVAAYFVPSTGSLFPLFPWSAFILAGVGLGQLYAHWRAASLRTYANAVLLIPGIAAVAFAELGRSWLLAVFGGGPGGDVPVQMLLRLGACLIILAGIAHASAHITRLPHIFGAVAQETLLIYFVHLCIVYGSIWNEGLAQAYGPTLGPSQTFICVVILMAAMTLLAWYWNWWKHSKPRAARWTSLAVCGVLLYRMF